jgi:hypothetical protein
MTLTILRTLTILMTLTKTTEAKIETTHLSGITHIVKNQFVKNHKTDSNISD